MSRVRVKTSGPFNKEAICHKCKCDTILSEYKEEAWAESGYYTDDAYPYIERKCTCCKFTWNEEPLDGQRGCNSEEHF